MWLQTSSSASPHFKGRPSESILVQMAGPNPFADELQAVAERREQSPADLANPYATPPGGREYQPAAGPGVGIWRLNEQVVIHQALDFPERCIYTNEAGFERRTLKLSWYEWCGLSHRSLQFKYSLSAAGAKRRAKEVFWPLAALGCGIVLFFVCLLFRDNYPGFGLGGDSLNWLGIAGGVLWLRGLWSSRWRILQLVHHDGPYFVLSGAGPAFVRSLPPWPGLLESRL